MQQEICTIPELKHWVRVQLASNGITQRELGRRMNLAYPRISEAVNGKMPGIKHLPQIILELGGEPQQFSELLHDTQNS